MKRFAEALASLNSPAQRLSRPLGCYSATVILPAAFEAP